MTNYVTNYVYVLNDESAAMPVYIINNAADFDRWVAIATHGFMWGMAFAAVMLGVGMINRALKSPRISD